MYFGLSKQDYLSAVFEILEQIEKQNVKKNPNWNQIFYISV